MANIFIDLFNMSITAGYLVLAVVVVRFLLKKAPKWINCLLWALVGIRLICPFSFESSLSLVPSSQTISVNNTSAGRPFSVQSGVPVVDNSINEVLGDKYYEGVTVPTNSFANVTELLAIIWIIGLIAMLLYGLISYLGLRKRVGASLVFEDNIYYCDNIDTPFILGFFKPKIYIPSGISEEQIGYIALHEKAHLKRKDHFWKPIGFILLSVYWFNPLIWVAYILLCRDIETACDEKVIKNMQNSEKKAYSETLVSCSVQRRMVMACPLAFGEVGVKQRIKSVLNYKKPAFWVVILAFVLFTVVAVCFISNPVNTKVDKILNEDGYTVLSAKESQKFAYYFVSSIVTDEMLERDGVYKVRNEEVYNDCVIFRFKEVQSKGDMLTLTFDVTYEDVPDDGTIYMLDSSQFDGGLELGDEITVYDMTGIGGHYSTYCHSKGPGTEFSFSVPKEWFKNRRDCKISVEFDVLAVVYEKVQKKGGSSSIGIIGGADGPTSIIVSEKNTKKEIKKLQEKYPHFFGLDTENGVIVYVTKLSQYNYECYITSSEIMDPQNILHFNKFASIEEMKLILSTYDINDVDIEVIPFQHNLSSFFWEKEDQDSEYLRSLLGLDSIYDEYLKNFNATVVDIFPQGIYVEPFENEDEWNEKFNKILIRGTFSCAVNEKVRIVYDGRVRNDLSTFPQNIVSAIAVYSITDEKENSKQVSINIDKDVLVNNTVIGFSFDDASFIKEMEEYEAKIKQTNDSGKYYVTFTESQYNKFLKDKYQQITTFYTGFETADTYSVVRKVEFDKDFRNLKIYVDKEQLEVMAYDCTEGVASRAYFYQMFLEEGIGVNVELVNYKTDKVYSSYTLPKNY